MTVYEKLKEEVDAVSTLDPRKDLLKRLLAKVEGDNLAYRKLQEAHDRTVEKLKDTKGMLKLQSYKALCLETLMVELYTCAESAYKDESYRELAMREMLPYLTAAGYDFEKQRTGIDE